MTFQEHSPAGHPADAGRCTTSRTLPRMDLAFLAGDAALAIAGDAARTGWGIHGHETIGGVVTGVALAAAVVQAASAGKGFRWADECEHAQPATSATAAR